MKKILIIDNAESINDPDYSKFSFVEYMHSCEDLDKLKSSDYVTAFIHEDNNSEVYWAKQNIEVVFVFSGGFSNPENIMGKSKLYYLPRSIFNRYIEEFLKYYQTNGNINPDIFWGN
jgi:hypothetical protein